MKNAAARTSHATALDQARRHLPYERGFVNAEAA